MNNEIQLKVGEIYMWKSIVTKVEFYLSVINQWLKTYELQVQPVYYKEDLY